MSRRSALSLAFGGVAALTLGPVLSACGAAARTEETASGGGHEPGARRVLLAYFSRPGENYWYGGRRNLRIGNTEILARTISSRIDCDVHRLRAADPYPHDTRRPCGATSASRKRTRPEIANPLRSIADYDTVLLGSPIWNVRPPMIMQTFADRYDFSGKTVHPIVTYAVSGLGEAKADYRAACPGARIGSGLAVRGEEARDAQEAADSWLRRIGLLA